MSCNCNSITVSSISLNSSGKVFTNYNGSFLVNDGGNNLSFFNIYNTVSDSTGLGYSLTILYGFQGTITQKLNDNNTGTDTATLSGRVKVTTPNVITNNTNLTFVVYGGLVNGYNFSVLDSNRKALSLTITLDSSTIFGNSTYEGVVSFTVTIAGKQILPSINVVSESVSLLTQIGTNNTLCLNITDIINNASIQILNSVSSINNSLNQLSKILKDLLPSNNNTKVS